MFDEIISLEEIGEENVYDLEIDSEFHNFYANDIVVHNCAYAYIAWQCLYFKTYYPVYFYTALLNQEDKTENIVQIINFTKSQGIKVKGIAIHKSSYNSTVEDDETIRLGYKLLKGMGTAAREEIELLQLNKCNTINQVLQKPFKKINNTVLNNLIDLGCFDELEPNRNVVKTLLSLYKEPKIEKWFTRKRNPVDVSTMPEILKEHFDVELVMDIARRLLLKPNAHFDLIRELSNKFNGEKFNKEEFEKVTIEKEVELLGFGLTLDKEFERFILKMIDKGMQSITDGIENIKDGLISNVYFKIDKVEVAMTKNKKPFLRFILNDGIKSYEKINMWVNGTDEQITKTIDKFKSAKYGIGNLKKNDFGINIANLEVPEY